MQLQSLNYNLQRYLGESSTGLILRLQKGIIHTKLNTKSTSGHSTFTSMIYY